MNSTRIGIGAISIWIGSGPLWKSLSHQDLLNDPTFHVGQTALNAVMLKRESFVVEASFEDAEDKMEASVENRQGLGTPRTH